MFAPIGPHAAGWELSHMHAHIPRLQSSTHLPETWGSKSPKHIDSLTGKQGGDPDRKGEENEQGSRRAPEAKEERKG